MISIRKTQTSRVLFVIAEPGVTSHREIMLTERELDRLQQEIMQVKAGLYQSRKDHKDVFEIGHVHYQGDV